MKSIMLIENKMKREELIKLLNKKAKEVKTGDNVREIIFTIHQFGLNNEEIDRVFFDVDISDEVWSIIEDSDKKKR